MNSVNNGPASEEETNELIDELRRQIAISDGDAVAGSASRAQENAGWAENFASRPYVVAGEDYLDYETAYVYGEVWYHSNPERRFEDCEEELAKGWDSARGGSPLDWPKAKPAVREAWYRVSDLAGQAKLERSELLSASPAGPTPGDH